MRGPTRCFNLPQAKAPEAADGDVPAGGPPEPTAAGEQVPSSREIFPMSSKLKRSRATRLSGAGGSFSPSSSWALSPQATSPGTDLASRASQALSPLSAQTASEGRGVFAQLFGWDRAENPPVSLSRFESFEGGSPPASGAAGSPLASGAAPAAAHPWRAMAAAAATWLQRAAQGLAGLLTWRRQRVVPAEMEAEEEEARPRQRFSFRPGVEGDSPLADDGNMSFSSLELPPIRTTTKLRSPSYRSFGAHSPLGGSATSQPWPARAWRWLLRVLLGVPIAAAAMAAWLAAALAATAAYGARTWAEALAREPPSLAECDPLQDGFFLLKLLQDSIEADEDAWAAPGKKRRGANRRGAATSLLEYLSSSAHSSARLQSARSLSASGHFASPRAADKPLSAAAARRRVMEAALAAATQRSAWMTAGRAARWGRASAQPAWELLLLFCRLLRPRLAGRPREVAAAARGLADDRLRPLVG